MWLLLLALAVMIGLVVYLVLNNNNDTGSSDKHDNKHDNDKKKKKKKPKPKPVIHHDYPPDKPEDCKFKNIDCAKDCPSADPRKQSDCNRCCAKQCEGKACCNFKCSDLLSHNPKDPRLKKCGCPTVHVDPPPYTWSHAWH